FIKIFLRFLTIYLFGSFTSNSSLILYKPEFERKSCATVRTTIVAATATINGKDVELLKAGASFASAGG
ncbi:hypothetical protein ACUOA8_59565, partial [Escherichia sp. SS-MK2]